MNISLIKYYDFYKFSHRCDQKSENLTVCLQMTSQSINLLHLFKIKPVFNASLMTVLFIPHYMVFHILK